MKSPQPAAPSPAAGRPAPGRWFVAFGAPIIVHHDLAASSDLVKGALVIMQHRSALTQQRFSSAASGQRLGPSSGQPRRARQVMRLPLLVVSATSNQVLRWGVMALTTAASSCKPSRDGSQVKAPQRCNGGQHGGCKMLWQARLLGHTRCVPCGMLGCAILIVLKSETPFFAGPVAPSAL